MSGFSDPVIGGGGDLVRERIRSPNYATGAEGWSINQDGSAEFNQVTVRGEVDVGTANQYTKIANEPPPIDGPAIVFNSDAATFSQTDGFIRAIAAGPGSAYGALFLSSPEAPGQDASQLTLTSGDGTNPRTADVGGDLLVNGDLSVEPAVGSPALQASSTGVSVGGALDVSGVFTLDTFIIDPGPWTPWTPVWSSSLATQPVLGNGSRQSRYKITGKSATFLIRYVFGTSTTFGSGAWGFTLPFTPKSTTEQAAAAFFSDDSASNRIPGTAWITASAGVFRVLVPAGGVGASSTVPFTWAANDSLVITGTVELD